MEFSPSFFLSSSLFSLAAGYLAQTPDEYAKKMYEALTIGSEKEVERKRRRGREASERFSDAMFAVRFVECVQPMILAAKR